MTCRYCGHRIIKRLIGWRHGNGVHTESIHIARPEKGWLLEKYMTR